MDPLILINPRSQGKYLRQLRTAVGWNQTQVGVEVGVHQREISKLERDELPAHWPSTQRLIAAVEAVLKRQLAAPQEVAG
jgi:transcriptional regulator with XRE-family HTH domain